MTGGTVRYSWHSTLTWLRNVAPLACEGRFNRESGRLFYFFYIFRVKKRFSTKKKKHTQTQQWALSGAHSD